MCVRAVHVDDLAFGAQRFDTHTAYIVDNYLGTIALTTTKSKGAVMPPGTSQRLVAHGAVIIAIAQ